MSDYKNITPGGNDTAMPLNVKRRIELIRKYADLKDKFILDCGCGSGGYILEFFKYSPNVFGVECDEEKVKFFKSLNVNPSNVIAGNIESLPFEDNKFDLVFLNEVLEHVQNEQKALSEIKRVLKTGGLLVLFSPNRLYPFETHEVTTKIRNISLPYYFPFIPYIPLVLGSKIINYTARNYFPWQLRDKIGKHSFKIFKHLFLWQTFENISGKSPKLLILAGPFLRKISFILEKTPFLNIFGVSQVLIAEKYYEKFER